MNFSLRQHKHSSDAFPTFYVSSYKMASTIKHDQSFPVLALSKYVQHLLNESLPMVLFSA